MYNMKLPTFDNSIVFTRQVTRQRERLAKKGMSDSFTPKRTFSSSKYMPHNGKQEMARRVRQAAA